METNIIQLSPKAPYGPLTAIQQIVGFIERLRGSELLSRGYLINGAHARFTWGGRTYTLVVQDIGPVPKEGA